MLLKTENLSFGFDDTLLFEKVNLQLEEGQKVALIGPNGCGKSTFLSLLRGEMAPWEGQVVRRNGLDMGFQSQFRVQFPQRLLWEEFEQVFEHTRKAIHLPGEQEIDHEMLAYEKKIRSILKGLEFDEEDWQRPLETFSGGELTRISLGKLFLKDHDLLLLDEPTNHLDLPSVYWLEKVLVSYPGAILMISHDRELVSATANRVVEINGRSFWVFNTGYEEYLQQREKKALTLQREAKNMAREIDRQKAIIEQYRRWGQEKFYKLMHSREKMLARLEEKAGQLDALEETSASLGRLPEPSRTERIVLRAENICVGFEDAPLFHDVSFEVEREQKVVLLGKNGVGKTTLLRLIAGELSPWSGELQLASKAKPAFLSQDLSDLHPENDVYNELYLQVPSWNDFEVRKYAGRFGFFGEDVFKPVSVLSGGEKLKLSLAKIILHAPNFLVLDEPTNHLDLDSIERLEEVLSEYKGAVLMVTHDRRLLKKVSNRLLLLRRNGIYAIHSLDAYLEQASGFSRQSGNNREKKRKKVDFEQQKKVRNRMKALQERMQQIEKTFEQREEALKQVQGELFSGGNFEKLQKLQREERELSREMEGLLQELEDTEQEYSQLEEQLGE
ncbi:MAG TPA: ATP-binding cassette domain-containing protein [Thermotogota bacterium]|nr:ATP-binding cassette domain-containing protein [Thermotogota bacterium]HRW92415.1 ATP-binding cassette domain-containing protein [Thermotogota bacterium]